MVDLWNERERRRGNNCQTEMKNEIIRKLFRKALKWPRKRAKRPREEVMKGGDKEESE